MIDKRKQIIEVVPYDSNWPKQFESEAALIKPIFAENFSAIYHVGSTAVLNMPAKPTIDIILAVKNIKLVDACNLEMEKLEYEAWGEYRIAGRRFFVKGNEKRTHHVHTFQVGSNDITRHIYFRDYLIAHPDEAKIYADLKIMLAKKFSRNRRAYVTNKEDFVKQLEEKAIHWALQKNK